MATKVVLLSYLLMGMGITQHPVSEETQTPQVNSWLGFATSDDHPLPPDEWGCKFSPDDIAKYEAIGTRMDQMAEETRMECLPAPTVPDTPECEPVQEYVGFLEQKCSDFPLGHVLFNRFARVKSDSSGSWTIRPAGYGVLDHTNPPPIAWVTDWIHEFGLSGICGEPPRASFPSPICAQFGKSIEWCKSCPETTECQPLSQQLKLDSVQYWDDKGVNDKSCPSDTPDNQSEDPAKYTRTITFPLEPTPPRYTRTITLPLEPTPEASLERRRADEPYHPTLKPIYIDCNVLEDPEQHTRCVLAELERALCELEPWIRECQDLDSGRADELWSKSATIDSDLLDEIFDTDEIVSVAGDDDVTRPTQVGNAPEETEIARLIEEMPSPTLEKLSQECEHAVGYNTVGQCVYEKLRDEVCSSHAGDELCEVPRATLINEIDLPLLHQDR